MNMKLDEQFWNTRYQTNDTGWDLAEVSTPLKEYFDQLTNKELSILIPGGGNSYEAEYLHKLGFKNVYVVDLSETALANIKERVPSFPSENLIHQNFFEVDLKFDLIIEQTFFCAINPSLRESYVEKTNSLLDLKGKIVGLLFDAPLNTDHPTYGGSKEEYLKLFSPVFNVEVMLCCFNSVESRKGRELFIKLSKQ